MRVTVLGCGGSAGVPQLGGANGRGDWGQCDPTEPRNRRTRSSIAVDLPEGRMLVDTGPDLRDQLLANGIGQVDAVLYTHAHADHIMGLDEIRILNRLIGRPIEAYGTQVVLDDIRSRFSYAFGPWTPPIFFRPVLVPRPILPDETHMILGAPISVIGQDHGFSQTLGLRIGSFAYSTDVVALDDNALEALHGIEIWLVDCFQRNAHKTHAHLQQVLRWNERVKAQRVILTHMSYDLDWAWMTTHLPDGVEPGFDGMRIAINAG